MINERYVKKSPNISSFYSWSDAKIYDVQTSSHRYLWQGLACLWSPLKVFQQKPVLFGSLGTNMLQYIIQESLQATWNAESGLFEGGRGALEYRTGFFLFFFSAAYLLREKFSCLSFFSSTWLHWLIRFHVESVFVHSQHILAAKRWIQLSAAHYPPEVETLSYTNCTVCRREVFTCFWCIQRSADVYLI